MENWVVFFDLFSKNGNGDSIRPVAEELRRQRPDMKFIFVSKKKKMKIDMADDVIVHRSKNPFEILKYHHVISHAKYLVSPMGFPNVKKRKGQFWLQTWHGNVIKSTYLHKEDTPKMRKKMAIYKNADAWCTCSEATTEVYMKTFGLECGIFIKTGLPRNDILFAAPGNVQIDIPEDKKVMFYCPTWRNAKYKMPFMLDIARLKEKFGQDYVLLIRAHVGKHDWIDADGKPFDINDDFVIDVGQYPNISELYLASDIFITDYSSAVFDFALTKKPVILFAYDLEDYKQNTGFCIDYENEMPGPIVFNNDELIDAIENIGTQDTQKYAAFLEKFCKYETGNAANLVVEELLKR
jgi:CDP-glycerol glycerophosphotransferase